MPGDIAVIVCSHAGDDRMLALRALRTAAAQGPVVLVDMSPGTELVQTAGAIQGVTARHVPESSGLAESRQIGLASTAARYVAFLDSDAVPREGWLAALREAAAPADVGVSGGPVLPVWPAGGVPRLFRTQAAGDFLSMLDLGDERIDTPRVLPGNMLVDREVTGEDVFATERGRRPGTLAGAEEIGMMLRLVGEGRRILYEPRAAVEHRTKPERMSWLWMWRRLVAAGKDSVLDGTRLDPLPRRLGLSDWLFLAVGAPPYLAGRLYAQLARSHRLARSPR